MIPDSGYNVASLKICFNGDGTLYPSLKLLKHFKTYEEALEAEKKLVGDCPEAVISSIMQKERLSQSN